MSPRTVWIVRVGPEDIEWLEMAASADVQEELVNGFNQEMSVCGNHSLKRHGRALIGYPASVLLWGLPLTLIAVQTRERKLNHLSLTTLVAPSGLVRAAT